MIKLALIAVLLQILPTVQGTLPAFVAGNGACLGTGHPMDDLDSLQAWFQRSGSRTPQIAIAASVRHMEGQRYSTTIPTLEVATTWWITKRLVSGWSCPSNYVGVNLRLDVPPGTPVPSQYFDVAGRRLSRRPTMHGVYFVRRVDGASWPLIIK